MGRSGLWVVLIWAVLATAIAFPASGEEPAVSPPPAATSTKEIVVSGKLYCSLKRGVIIPFQGEFVTLEVHVGQAVKEGDVIARYRLTPEAKLQLERRLASFQITELEMRLAEMKGQLAKLAVKERELKQLAEQNLAPAQGLNEVEREMGFLRRQQGLIQDRLSRERELAKADLALVREALNDSVKPGHLPEEATLTAPITGNVIWIHGGFRPGAQFQPGSVTAVVGVMDPMVLRAPVHEIEAVQLKVGDVGRFSVESIPGRTFDAAVSRVSWTPITSSQDQPSYYEIEFEVPNPDLALKEGLKGQVALELPAANRP